MWDTLLNILVCCLMGWAIYMGIRLDKRLRLFQKHRENLDQLSQGLQAALLRAEGGLKNLQEISHTHGNALQETIVKARHLHDELSFVIDHGEKLSARLEEEMTQARQYLKQGMREPRASYGGSVAPLPAAPNPIEIKTAPSSGPSTLLDTFQSLENLR